MTQTQTHTELVFLDQFRTKTDDLWVFLVGLDETEPALEVDVFSQRPWTVDGLRTWLPHVYGAIAADAVAEHVDRDAEIAALETELAEARRANAAPDALDHSRIEAMLAATAPRPDEAFALMDLAGQLARRGQILSDGGFSYD